MKKNLIYLMFMMMLFSFFNIMKVEAQVTIGESIVPHPGAVLELRTSKGFLLSKASLADADTFQLSAEKTEEAVGMLVYNTNPDIVNGNGKGVYVWDGLHWNPVTKSSSGGNSFGCDEAPTISSITGFSGTYDMNGRFDVVCSGTTSGITSCTWDVPPGLTAVSGNGTEKIVLQATAPGVYSGYNLNCTVSNACGKVTDTAGASQVTIVECLDAPSRIYFSPLPISMRAYEPFTVICNAATSGSTYYKWSTTGVDILYGQGTERVTLSGSSIGVQSVSITCTLTNACGENTATITHGMEFY